jgi:hypothetical protein
MMTDHWDSQLKTLFAESRQELDGEALTARVMARTRKLSYMLIAGGISAVLVLLTGAWLVFALPLLEFAVLISQGLTMTLVDLGEGWLALVFLPVNNIASLLVLSMKAIHMARKKIIGASFGK